MTPPPPFTLGGTDILKRREVKWKLGHAYSVWYKNQHLSFKITGKKINYVQVLVFFVHRLIFKLPIDLPLLGRCFRLNHHKATISHMLAYGGSTQDQL